MARAASPMTCRRARCTSAFCWLTTAPSPGRRRCSTATTSRSGARRSSTSSPSCRRPRRTSRSTAESTTRPPMPSCRSTYQKVLDDGLHRLAESGHVARGELLVGIRSARSPNSAQDRRGPRRRRPQAPGGMGGAVVARRHVSGVDRARALQRAGRHHPLSPGSPLDVRRRRPASGREPMNGDVDVRGIGSSGLDRARSLHRTTAGRAGRDRAVCTPSAASRCRAGPGLTLLQGRTCPSFAIPIPAGAVHDGHCDVRRTRARCLAPLPPRPCGAGLRRRRQRVRAGQESGAQLRRRGERRRVRRHCRDVRSGRHQRRVGRPHGFRQHEQVGAQRAREQGLCARRQHPHRRAERRRQVRAVELQLRERAQDAARPEEHHPVHAGVRAACAAWCR